MVRFIIVIPNTVVPFYVLVEPSIAVKNTMIKSKLERKQLFHHTDFSSSSREAEEIIQDRGLGAGSDGEVME